MQIFIITCIYDRYKNDTVYINLKAQFTFKVFFSSITTLILNESKDSSLHTFCRNHAGMIDLQIYDFSSDYFKITEVRILKNSKIMLDYSKAFNMAVVNSLIFMKTLEVRCQTSEASLQMLAF